MYEFAFMAGCFVFWCIGYMVGSKDSAWLYTRPSVASSYCGRCDDERAKHGIERKDPHQPSLLLGGRSHG